jgi:hypothetical protein
MTDKITITNWIKQAAKENARWLIVACDTYDNSDYPISFREDQIDECLKKILHIKQGLNMQRLMEVYDLKKPIEDQLNAHRAMELPQKFIKIDDVKTTEQILAIKTLDKISKAGGAVQAVVKSIIEDEQNSLKDQFDKLTDEQRLKLFSYYCKHCGSKDPKCKCWDDS